MSPFAADRVSNETISHTLELSGLSFSVNENTTRRWWWWLGGFKKKKRKKKQHMKAVQLGA